MLLLICRYCLLTLLGLIRLRLPSSFANGEICDIRWDATAMRGTMRAQCLSLAASCERWQLLRRLRWKNFSLGRYVALCGGAAWKRRWLCVLWFVMESDGPGTMAMLRPALTFCICGPPTPWRPFDARLIASTSRSLPRCALSDVNLWMAFIASVAGSADSAASVAAIARYSTRLRNCQITK